MILMRSFKGCRVAVTMTDGTTFTGRLERAARACLVLSGGQVTGGAVVPGLLVLERAHVVCWQVVTDA